MKQLFDISTTVDPSYVISLIRKLLPVDSGTGERYNHHMNANNVAQGVVARSGNGVVDTSNGDSESMDIEGNHNESTSEEKDTVGLMEEVWEDHGCVLWDLAASRTHAELMVQNLILEVLHANLMVSKSARIRGSMNRSCPCSVLITAALICGAYFIGNAYLAKEFKETKQLFERG